MKIEVGLILLTQHMMVKDVSLLGLHRGKSLVWEKKIVGAATIVADSRV